MNLEHIRTFLEIAACGNFNRAAETLNVTQSTVSARIKSLEASFGRRLFHRNHAGAQLTAAGQHFLEYAMGMQQLWRQAQQTVNLPPDFQAMFGLAAQVSLWEHLILDWIPWMRTQAPNVALRIEADYSPSQMQQLRDGLIDIGVMYQPRQTPELIIEKLLEEKLVLVSTRARESSNSWVADYVYVDWGDVYRFEHAKAFPETETAAVNVGLGALGLQYILKNGGSGYFPLRVVGPLIATGELVLLTDVPEVIRPAYVVYHAKPKYPAIQNLALDGLRRIAAREEG